MRRLEVIAYALIAVGILTFLAWFVLAGPTPDYLPEYGSDPRDIPQQMKD